MSKYAKHYDSVEAIKFDGSMASVKNIVNMCEPVDFRVKRYADDEVFGLLEVDEEEQNIRAYVKVDIGYYVIKEPNGFCYTMPADIFELIHSKMEH